MKKNKGFAPILLALIIVALLAVGDIAYNAIKSSNTTPSRTSQNTGTNSYQPSENQNGSTNVPVQNQTINTVINNPTTNIITPTGCLPTSVPSITVTSPSGGEAYTLGQQITVKWTSCNVQNLYLGLVSGGKDFGELNTTPILASQGSLQFTVSNPAQSFTQSNINSYQIVIESQSPNVMVRSGVFSVSSPVIATLKLTSTDNGKTFNVTKGQAISVTLCNPGDTGYQFDAPQYSSSILQLTSHKNISSNNPPGFVGGCYGNDVFEFKALNSGTSNLNITASRSFQSGSSINEFSSVITVK